MLTVILCVLIILFIVLVVRRISQERSWGCLSCSNLFYLYTNYIIYDFVWMYVDKDEHYDSLKAEYEEEIQECKD